MILLSASVFDLRGPEFLHLYFYSLGVAVIVALAWRWAMSGPWQSSVINPQLDAFEIACLGGGRRRVVNAAIASLLQRGVVKMSGKRAVETVASVPSDLHPVEQQITRLLKPGIASRLNDIYGYAQWHTVTKRLESMGLILTSSRRWMAGFVSAALVAIVLAMGVAKICIGVSRNRPVLYLVIVCVITLLVLIRFAVPPLQTFAGRRLFRKLKSDNAALNASAARNSRTLSGLDVALAFGLWGPVILTGTEVAAFGTLLRERSAGSGSSCGSSGCGSGGSCGGGGCGGGGCGGCGS